MNTPLIKKTRLNDILYNLSLTEKEFEKNILLSVAFLALLLKVEDGIGDIDINNGEISSELIADILKDTKIVTIYGTDINTIPTGGSYDWDSNTLVAPNNWTTSKIEETNRMSYGLSFKSTDIITWGDPILLGGEGSTDSNAYRLLSIFRAVENNPGVPSGGSYEWATDTLIPPTNWSKTRLVADYVWMSQGLGLKNNINVEWGEPVQISTKILPDEEGEGVLVTCYKNAITVTKPTKEEGTYDFSTGIFTPPNGWSLTRTTPNENEFTWQLFGFAYKGTDYISWGDPVQLGGGDGDVIIPDFKFKQISVFKGSITAPTAPLDSEGSYDFDTNKFTPPSGWKANRSEVILSEGLYRWMTTKIFFNNGEDGSWTTPVLDIDGDLIKLLDVNPFGLAWAYIESTERPATPSSSLGVFDYNSNTLLIPPTGWKTSVNACTKDDAHLYIWETTRVFLQNKETNWSTPSRYWDGEDIINDLSTNTKTFGVQIYKGTSSETNTLNAPANNEGSYDISTGILTPPNGWSLTPLQAKTAFGSDCKIWVSFNNYSVDYINGIAGLISSTGWTTPIPYIDIDAILAEADSRSKTIANNALEDALQDLTDALLRLRDNSAYVDSVVNSLAVLYSWQEVDSYDNNKVITTPSGVTTYELLVANCVGKDYYDTVVKLNGVAYQYTAYAVSLTTLLSDLRSELNEKTGLLENLLNTAVLNMTPEQIRLAVSKGQLEHVTWVKVDPISNCISVHQLPTNIDSIKFGSVYKTDINLDGKAEVAYYRADYPSSTGFLNILNDNVNIGIAKRADGVTDSATLEFYFGKSGSTAAITAKQIVLNGDVIADAIAAKSLNINNTTFLDANGNLLSGMGTGKAGNAFWANGTGYIAGGKLLWGVLDKSGNFNQGLNLTSSQLDGEFMVKVKGYIEANSGYFGPSSEAGWNIGVVNDGVNGTLASLYGKSSTGEEIRIQPNKIYSKDSSGTTYWLLSSENKGYVSLANGAFEAGYGVDASMPNKYAVSIKGHIEADSGYIGNLEDHTKGWTIGTYEGEGAIYTGTSTGKHLAITPSSIRGGNTSTDAWQLNADGTGFIGYGFANWNSNQMHIGGWRVDNDSIQNGFVYLNSSGLLYNKNNEKIQWQFNPDGSGLLARGNIYWTADGNLSVIGKITANSGKIGSWDILDIGLCGGHIHIHSDGNIFAQESTEHTENDPYWILRGDGSGFLGHKLIEWYNSNNAWEVIIADWRFHKVNGIGEILSMDDKLHILANGSMYAGSSMDNPWWLLKSDGSGSLGNLGITWDANGYNAKIAGWSINSDKLTATSNGNTLEISPSNGISLSNKWSLNTDGSAIFASGALECRANGLVIIDLSGSIIESGSTVPTATHLDGKGLAFYQGANASENTALPEYSIGIDGVLKKLSDDGYVLGLFYMLITTKMDAETISSANPGVLIAVPESETVSTVSGYISSNRTGRRK